ELGCDAFCQQSGRGRSFHRVPRRLRGFARCWRPVSNGRARRTRRVGGPVPQRYAGGRPCPRRAPVTMGMRTLLLLRCGAQALVWLTLAVPLFVSVAGLAVDGGVLLEERRELQSVVDGAARAGATQLDMPRLRASGGADVQLNPTL